jgi:hypothetical protein
MVQAKAMSSFEKSAERKLIIGIYMFAATRHLTVKWGIRIGSLWCGHNYDFF